MAADRHKIPHKSASTDRIFKCNTTFQMFLGAENSFYTFFLCQVKFEGRKDRIAVMLCSEKVCFFQLHAYVILVLGLHGLVGTIQGGQTYVVSFERYIHRYYRKHC